MQFYLFLFYDLKFVVYFFWWRAICDDLPETDLKGEIEIYFYLRHVASSVPLILKVDDKLD